MRQVTAQEKLNAVNEGAMSKKAFVQSMKREFPQFISNFDGFDSTVSILKTRKVITEKVNRKKAYEDPQASSTSLDALDRGTKMELAAMGCDCLNPSSISKEDYSKAYRKALTNLKKNASHYIDLIAKESSSVDKNDKMKETKRGAKDVDTYNSMKKATLKEVKEQMTDQQMKDIQNYGNPDSIVKPFKPGDMFSSNFDYEGMLEAGLKLRLNTPLETMQAIYDSFEDVNYHSENQHLGAVIDAREEGDKSEALDHLRNFKKAVKQTLLGLNEGGDPLRDVLESEKKVAEGPEDANYKMGEAFKRYGIDLSKDVIVAEMDGGTPQYGGGKLDIEPAEPAMLVAKRLERHRLDTILDYESEGSMGDFPVMYEDGFYGDYTPEGTEHKLTYSEDGGTMWDIFQAPSGVSEKKGKDHDGDGDIDGDDYMAAKDKAIKGAMGKDIDEIDSTLDPYEDKKEIVRQVIQLIKSEMPADNETIKDFIRTHYNDIINLGDDMAILDEFKEFLSVNTDSVDELSEDPMVDEHDFNFFQTFFGVDSKEVIANTNATDEEIEAYLKSDDYQEELKHSELDEKDISNWVESFLEWRAGSGRERITVSKIYEAIDNGASSKKVSMMLQSYKTMQERKETKHSNEKLLKEAVKAIIRKTLLKEAHTATLQSYIDKDYDQEVQDAAKSLMDIIEKLEKEFISHKSALESAYEKAGSFLAPALEKAFMSDLSSQRASFEDVKLPKTATLSPEDLARIDQARASGEIEEIDKLESEDAKISSTKVNV